MSEALEVAEHNRCAVSLREPADLRVYRVRIFFMFERGDALLLPAHCRVVLSRHDRAPIANAALDRIGPGADGDADSHAIEPASDRSTVADGMTAAGQHQKGRLKGVMSVVMIVEDRPAHAHDHRAMADHKRFKRKLAAFIAGREEPLEQLPVAESGQGPRSEKRLDRVGKRVNAKLRHGCRSPRSVGCFYP